MVERYAEDVCEGGSIPSFPASYGCEQDGNALACKAMRTRFNSVAFVHLSRRGLLAAAPECHSGEVGSIPTACSIQCVAGLRGEGLGLPSQRDGFDSRAMLQLTGVKCYGSTPASNSGGQGSIPCSPANGPIV